MCLYVQALFKDTSINDTIIYILESPFSLSAHAYVQISMKEEEEEIFVN